MPSFTALLVGSDTLTIEAGKMLLEAGHPVRGLVTRSDEVRAWAESRDLPLFAPGPKLASRIGGLQVDWLLSVANLDLLPDDVLALPRRGAVNFHDGPLPAHAGLNAPVWALLEGERAHGISWHLIEGGVDEGDLLVTRPVEIGEGETALSLNLKCFAAAIESFPEVMEALSRWELPRTKQDLSQRRVHRAADRPPQGGLLDFRTVEGTLRLVRALDHGGYRNPVALPRILVWDRTLIVRSAEPADGEGEPGAILASGPGTLTVATGDGAIRLSGLQTPMGLAATDLPGSGATCRTEVAGAEAAVACAARFEPDWERRLDRMAPAAWGATPGPGGAPWQKGIVLPPQLTTEQTLAAFPALICAMTGGAAVDIALGHGRGLPGITADWMPLRYDPEDGFAAAATALVAEVADLSQRAPFAIDLPARLPALAGGAMPMAALSLDAPVEGAAVTLVVGAHGLRLHADPARIAPAEAALIAARLEGLLAALPRLDDDTAITALPILPEAERRLLVEGWNATEREVDRRTIHALVAEQAGRTPDAPAVTFEGTTLSFAELEDRAARIAGALRARGIAPGAVIGLHAARGTDLVAGALGILRAGCAYLPLDPAYPADRIALYLSDSNTALVLSDAPGDLPEGTPALALGADEIAGAEPLVELTGGPDDLAYLIYTSGSTGRPKGVMIEHAQVANFFAGMDERIPHAPGDAWLAVTSLSFDISVLELFWTLSRGMHVVVASEAARTLTAEAPARGMEMSLYYWGNDDGAGRDKYALLLDGARFADENGFCAVWTPERHFHAFGGPYPNPSVTGAAVAGLTRNIGVRAGSCVAPLHHVARIAEEWAVIDNLTDGRAGLAIASGWQPDDFVLRPENTPPANKPAMMDAIRDLRRLWAGEAVEFPKADGTMHAIVTQPRPVSPQPRLWVTTAGNPDTWREAGANGCNVLTHLLGQSVEEVGQKIALYHEALRAAGHDPAQFTVTLMLHTYLADSRAQAREIAREPMKDYLRSAAGLIKQYAWAFPAFKKPQGVETPMQLDLGSLEAEELDAILDFAFERYFEESGLFGTVEDAVARIDGLKAIGVGEVACLIDYGIARETVLEGLRPLAEVLRRVNDGTGGADHSLAGLIAAHRVSHLQCTPSMARMMLAHDETRAALGRLRHLMIGGEALPGGLVRELRQATGAEIENMYGPTETTIWSSTQPARADQVTNGIGTPIANTRLYVLDEAMRPCPVGVTGELWIGGDGVARGYWDRPDLTAERFRPDPFAEGRVYRTGDLARWRADGTVDFLGRADGQVKLRGHRIETGEIAATLEAAGAAQAVVLLREDRLVAYVTGGPGEAELRAALSARLPAAMVPARIVGMEAFPLTPNGKVDTRALPAPAAPRPADMPAPAQMRDMDPAPEDRPARTGPPAIPPASTLAGSADATATAPAGSGPPADEVVRQVWSATLGVSDIRARDSFFELGGHSILAVQAHRALREATGLRALSITDVFRFPTLSALAGRIEALGYRAGPGPEAPAPDAGPTDGPATPTPGPDVGPAAPAPGAGDPPEDVRAAVLRALAAPAEAEPDETRERTEVMDRRKALRLLKSGEP
ncbi:MupA/Atu3671 family FMN-dependent luciferase-like monooxygenase [Wenxinia saemankumensis]|uniref:Natural product biosynthesis luciferase-like monooxygenase domain-containing protein n=1 Tax=Wenxinia saemankumensis TaxID=1447782 RepID=A0A1M6FZB4_9RHOB|nr:MupA/Atu3671 family FMN-dependent luciferase-like monooxygenase [Wenxinia saemankumensis]SHJ03095.1 natural product biosynthesis luciferase-like monooxygenase domain-containing protein [Wenxinia saemankumensis]